MNFFSLYIWTLINGKQTIIRNIWMMSLASVQEQHHIMKYLRSKQKTLNNNPKTIILNEICYGINTKALSRSFVFYRWESWSACGPFITLFCPRVRPRRGAHRARVHLSVRRRGRPLHHAQPAWTGGERTRSQSRDGDGDGGGESTASALLLSL